MKPEIEAEYKAKLRDFMEREGRKVEFNERERERHPEWPEFHVSTYGWTDYEAERHIHAPAWRETVHGDGCKWVVPEGAELVEQTYSQFTDTFSDNEQEVGINVSGCHCACGKYTDVTLRYVGTLSQVLHSLLGLPVQPKITL
jgi:hypothetical protein